MLIMRNCLKICYNGTRFIAKSGKIEIIKVRRLIFGNLRTFFAKVIYNSTIG